MPSPRNFMVRHGVMKSRAPQRTTIRVYRMNPSHDQVMYAEDLVEGLWVIPDMPQRAHRQMPLYDRRRAEMRSMITNIRDDNRARVRRWIAVFPDGVQQGFVASFDDTYVVSSPSCRVPPPPDAA